MSLIVIYIRVELQLNKIDSQNKRFDQILNQNNKSFRSDYNSKSDDNLIESDFESLNEEGVDRRGLNLLNFDKDLTYYLL